MQIVFYFKSQWDTAGQERYRSITNAYYRGAEALVIVFDLTNRESFYHISDWIEEITKFTGTNIVRIALANKVDLKEERAVMPEDIKDFESKTNIPVYEVSAKSGVNIELAFKSIVDFLVEKKYSI